VTTSRPDEDDQQPTRGRRSGCMMLVAIALVAGAAYGSAFLDPVLRGDPAEDLRSFVPTPAVPDPSLVLPGIVVEPATGLHVGRGDRVAYTAVPPTGGSHDEDWAACDGVVYDEAIRSETAVHSLEHGAVWIAFDPEQVVGDELERLAVRARGVPYTLMSPYPDLPTPISLQSWGHRLGVGDATDPTIDPFITALRQNPNTHPEVGASCAAPAAEPGPPPFAPPPAAGEIGRAGVVAADAAVPAPQPHG
jgi:hypothetical protein